MLSEQKDLQEMEKDTYTEKNTIKKKIPHRSHNNVNTPQLTSSHIFKSNKMPFNYDNAIPYKNIPMQTNEITNHNLNSLKGTPIIHQVQNMNNNQMYNTFQRPILSPLFIYENNNNRTANLTPSLANHFNQSNPYFFQNQNINVNRVNYDNNSPPIYKKRRMNEHAIYAHTPFIYNNSNNTNALHSPVMINDQSQLSPQEYSSYSRGFSMLSNLTSTNDDDILINKINNKNLIKNIQKNLKGKNTNEGIRNAKMIFKNFNEEEMNKLNIEDILLLKDKRTTLMIKNIPNKYTIATFLDEINEEFKNAYDIFYLPIDYRNKCNLGFAFINFVDPFHIITFYYLYRGKKWKRFNSEKICELVYAKIQGKKELIAHFEKGKVLSFCSEEKRPLILPTANPLPKVKLPIQILNAFIKAYPFAKYTIEGNKSDSEIVNVNTKGSYFTYDKLYQN